MAGFGRALAVMVIGTFLTAAFFGGVAPAIQPLIDYIGSSAAVGSGSPFSGSIIDRISFILFILGPMLLLLAAILFPIVAGLRREVFLGRR